jgi:hypothetical protein
VAVVGEIPRDTLSVAVVGEIPRDTLSVAVVGEIPRDTTVRRCQLVSISKLWWGTGQYLQALIAGRSLLPSQVLACSPKYRKSL